MFARIETLSKLLCNILNVLEHDTVLMERWIQFEHVSVDLHADDKTFLSNVYHSLSSSTTCIYGTYSFESRIAQCLSSLLECMGRERDVDYSSILADVDTSGVKDMYLLESHDEWLRHIHPLASTMMKQLSYAL